MLNRLIPATLLALTLSLATAARAQNAQPAASTPPPLTLEQCVAMALDKNFDLRIQRIDTAASVNSLEIAKAEYDPTLTGGIHQSYSRSDAYGTGNAGGSHSTTLDAGVSQKLITGATLQLGYGASRASTSNPANRYDPNWGSGLSLSVRQPILKNFGSTVNKAAIERARLNIDRSNYDLKGTVLTTIRSVESAFYNLSFVRARLEIRDLSLQNAQTLLRENRTRREVGTATNLDVLQAEVGVATAQRDILVAQQAAKTAEDALLALINPFQFEVGVGPLALADVGQTAVSFDRSYKLARDNSPELASTRLAIKQSEIDLDVAKQNRLPQLDVVGSAGYDATRSTYFKAIGKTLSQDDHDWSIGATITYPWGQRREKANLANAKANLDASQIGLEKLDQTLLVQVRNAIRSVQTSDEGVRISALAAKLSEEQYELEKARLAQGLSTVRRVQEAEEDMRNARFAEIDARVSLRNALADLARLEGSSLTTYSVQLAR